MKELRAKIKNEAVDIGGLENEVYDHLFSFFRRYYSEGDFLAKRVYKPGVYAIPYEGEEVKFYWANSDQYYIKTSEHLRDYAFRLRPYDNTNPMRVHFRLTDSAEGEHGNVKEANGKERVFVLKANDFVAAENDELVIRFEYRPTTFPDWPEDVRGGKTKPPAQKDLIELAVKRVLAVDDPSLATWIAGLGRREPTEQQSDRTLLQKHIRNYSSVNTFDYFIHKELGKFLRQELDFYIKNEVMHLDDVQSETAPRVEQYLSKIKVIRGIAEKIIDFLAQLEDFQKRLWLKRKFVFGTHYCISLDRVAEKFYPEIVENEAQRNEWVSLFSIDEIPQYSTPISVEFLKANRHLPIDTSLFSKSFTERLVATVENVDELTDGVLIHGDNFQALLLMVNRLREQIKCIYIDPPYNTASSAIPYKNNYRHSSWISMIYDRLDALRTTLARDGAIFASIDKTERTVLQHAMDDVFDVSNRVEELIWSMNTNNSQAPNYSTNHEYVLVYAKDRGTAEQNRDMFREPKPGFADVMGLINQLNPSYPAVSHIETELRALYDRHRSEFRDEIEASGLDWEEEKTSDPWKGLYNYNRAEYRDQTGALVTEAEAEAKKARIWIWREADLSMPATKQSASTRDLHHPNWRFYKPIHPITGQRAPHPKSGWKFAYNDDADLPERRSFVSLDQDSRIAWGDDEKKVPQLKRFLHEVETNVGKSVFQDYSDGEKQTSAMFGRSGVFLAPKHSDFVSRFIVQAAEKSSTVLDCFGGSGSTAHAVLNLNREDRGRRRYILVEVAEYFDSVLKPRVLKAAYSKDWKSGKPISREGISQCVKVIRLESYEDALNNLEVRRTSVQQSLLDVSEAQGLRCCERSNISFDICLDVETRASPSLLTTQAFRDPTAYKLRVKRPGSDESREVDVDLLETFNWLIGLLCGAHRRAAESSRRS